MKLASLFAAVWSCLLALWALAAEHPAVTTYVVGTVFALLFKPKTPQEYFAIATRKPVWFFARAAAFLQLTGTLFSDVSKAQRILLEKILQGPPKPPPPMGPSVLMPGDIPEPPSTRPEGLNRRLGLVGLAFVVLIPSCALFTKENARTVLDAASVTCVFATEVTDEEAVARSCGLARELIPIIRSLIGQREAAKSVGVHWPAPEASDGGAK